jgi:hypothetical protein
MGFEGLAMPLGAALAIAAAVARLPVHLITIDLALVAIFMAVSSARSQQGPEPHREWSPDAATPEGQS